MQKNVAIIGAGISGMSLAQVLKLKNIKSTVFERDDQPGGIAKVRQVEGVPFHITGGHCFNSKYPEVLEFVFENILPKQEWNRVNRDAKIFLKEHFIDYPIEYNLKQLIKLNPTLGTTALISLLGNFQNPSKAKNLHQWFERMYGDTLNQLYFKPYNEKIWNQEIKNISPSWVQGKLPVTSKSEVLASLLGFKEKKMAHAKFFYPKKGQNAFVRALSAGIDITYNTEVNFVKKDGTFNIEGNHYTHLVYTGSMKKIITFLNQKNEELTEHSRRLKYNSVTTSLWKSKPKSHTWSYHPSKDSIFHRHVHIGNFLKESNPSYTITETIGKVDKECVKLAGSKIDYLIELIDFHQSDEAYVIFDHNHEESTSFIKRYCNERQIHLHGRFAEWQYYNMDICIKKSMDLAEVINES